MLLNIKALRTHCIHLSILFYFDVISNPLEVMWRACFIHPTLSTIITAKLQVTACCLLYTYSCTTSSLQWLLVLFYDMRVCLLVHCCWCCYSDIHWLKCVCCLYIYTCFIWQTVLNSKHFFIKSMLHCMSHIYVNVYF